MTSSSSARGMPGWLILVGAMSALGPFSIDMYLPGFPLIEQEFGEPGVERTMAAYLFGIALAQLVYGPVSDRFGRKAPLYVGLTLYALGALGCALAPNMSMLMLMRVVQAIGGCSPFVIGRAIVRDRCEPHEAAKAYAMLMSIIALGPIVAPVLGGWMITVSGWRSVFVFQAVAALGIVIAMHSMLVESLDPAHAQPLHFGRALRSYGRLLRDRVFVGYTCVGGFGFAGMFCFVAGSPLVMANQYALSPQQFGWVIAVNGIAFMSASRWNIVSLRRSTPSQVLASAIWYPVLITAVLTVASYAMHLPLAVVIAAHFCFFLAVGRTNPHVAALAMAPHAREAGTASALLGAIQSALGMGAGIAVALWSDATIARLATLMAACAALATASYLVAKR